MVDRGIEPQAVDLYRPDFPALARAVGAHGVDAASAEDLGRWPRRHSRLTGRRSSTTGSGAAAGARAGGEHRAVGPA